MKKEITKQWNEEFPSMSAWKTRWIMNIIGPLIVGVILEIKSDSENYYPKIFIDNLAESNKKAIYLQGCDACEPGSISSISKPDKYIGFAKELNENAIIPVDGDLTAKAILKYLKNYCATGYPLTDELNIMEIMVYFAAWTNQERLIMEVKRYIDSMENELIHRNHFNNQREYLEWINKIEKKVRDDGNLHDNVEENIKNFKLDKIPQRKVLL